MVGAIVASPAAAQPLPPSAALDWRDPRLPTVRQLVARLEAEATRGQRIGIDASLEPQLRFRAYPHDGTAGELSPSLGLNATIDFGDPTDTLARTLQRLERARLDLELLEIDSVTRALLAHANLLLAQEEASEAGTELAEARDELAQETRENGDVRAARLALQQAELEQREALFELDEARARADSFGLSGEAIYRPLRFRLPAGPVDASETHRFRLLELEVLEARAELEAATRRPFDDLRLRAGYRLPDIELELEGGLLNGEPGATVGVDLPGGVERWELEMSAQLLLGDDRLEIERLEAALAAARSELDAYPELFRVEQESALMRAQFAERALTLAEEEHALGGDGDRLYRAWIRYLRAVAEVLELGGGAWEVMQAVEQ